MIASQLAVALEAAIRARLPILIVGGPGIGKTSIVKQASIAAGSGLLIDHPALNDPTDAKGFPGISKDGKNAFFTPFGNIKTLLESTEPITWFLDDLGQATPATQASYMPWILERQVNGHRLPDHVTIIAATNRRTDRASVSGILEPVKSRFTAIIELEPSLPEWEKWALQQSFIPPEQIAFLRWKEGDNMLYQFVPSADMVNCPLPRTWENAGRILSMHLPPELEGPMLTGAVGEGAAMELMAYLQMYRQLPSVDAIIDHPDSADIPAGINILYAVSTAIAAKTNDRNLGNVGKFCTRLLGAGHGEFAALIIRDAMRRKPLLQSQPEFVRLMSGEIGQLIGGSIQ